MFASETFSWHKRSIDCFHQRRVLEYNDSLNSSHLQNSHYSRNMSSLSGFIKQKKIQTGKTWVEADTKQTMRKRDIKNI